MKKRTAALNTPPFYFFGNKNTAKDYDLSFVI